VPALERLIPSKNRLIGLLPGAHIERFHCIYILFNSYLLETCDLQLFNEILTILLNELQRKPASAVVNKKSSSVEANATSKKKKKNYIFASKSNIYLF